MNDREIESKLNEILYILFNQRKAMADIATDITNLTAAVSAVSTDVAAVLVLLKQAPNITPEQQGILEAQITALQNLDATVKAAEPPAPAPAPTPGS